MKFIALATLTKFIVESKLDGQFAQRLHIAGKLDSVGRHLKQVDAFLKHDSPFPIHSKSHRRLDDQMACDQAFMKCIPLSKCISCFATLETVGVDWASVSPGTPCRDVVDFLFKGKLCTDMQGDNTAIDSFCNTFDVCVSWDDTFNDDSVLPAGNSSVVDCASLTECNWKGFHRGFLGDGICHENYPGCYNTAVCNFDGGDCCEDSCVDKTSYAECGHDGFACRDPSSKRCDPKLTSKCITPDSSKSNVKPEPDPKSVTCKSGELKYRLIMYDSFGDGWDTTSLTLTNAGDKSVLFTGQLVNGAQGVEYICLSISPTCYHIQVAGGIWGNEVSWEIRPLGEGTKAIADGGAPMDCNFSVGENSCARTCNGKKNVNPSDDPEYKAYKDMYLCMQEKCVIQVGTCMGDSACAPCFKQDAPEYCFANDNFNSVIDCGLCQCTDSYSGYCMSKKSGPGAVIPGNKPDEQPSQKQCSAAETLQGSSSVLTFSKCTSFDQVALMVTDFDENNFGALDTFEACAHSYQNEPAHGGKTAMFCMTILSDAIAYPSNGSKDGVPAQAISTLASLLYHNAESFCECARTASLSCPLCPSFMRFKTLLYESLDACKALDEIDCDAWNEYYPKCKANLETKFSQVDFRTDAQCEFVKNNCGDSGPFPAFRKLDCGRELSKTAWDFYVLYNRSCLKGSTDVTPSITPTNGPASASTPNPIASPPTSKPYIPDGGGPTPYIPDGDKSSKPYVPPKDDPSGNNNSNPSGQQKSGSSHFWRNIFIIGILCCGAHLYYKRTNNSFSFVRYRSAPRNFGSESEMMMGGPSLSLSDSGNFEPPSLPPPPSALGQHGYP